MAAGSNVFFVLIPSPSPSSDHASVSCKDPRAVTTAVSRKVWPGLRPKLGFPNLFRVYAVALVLAVMDPFLSLSSCFIMPPPVMIRQQHSSFTFISMSASSKKQEISPTKSQRLDNEAEHDPIVDEVSDAEALLACWSYLQRRKRLGNWTQFEQRMAQQALSRTYFLTEDDLNEQRDEFDDDNEMIVSSSKEYTQEDDQEESAGAGASRPFASTGTAKDDLLFYGEFTSKESKPSPSQRRRSNALKKRWADPEYQKRWYASRWGEQRRNEKEKWQRQKNRNAEALARELPRGFLGSPELASMTKEEIAEAIATRVRSLEKRAEARKQTLKERKRFLEESNAAIFKAAEDDLARELDDSMEETKPKLNRNSLFMRTHEEMKEEQRKRAERAKKIYQTRMINEKARKEASAKAQPSHPAFLVQPTEELSKPIERRFYPPKQLTPRDALLRIEYALDKGELPTIEDVKLLLQPKRLANRKDLLCRLLSEGFGLYGKCVPVCDDSKPKEAGETPVRYEFVTHSSLERVGAFVTTLLSGEGTT